MAEIQSNFPLKKYHTFGMEVLASQYINCTSAEEIAQVLKNSNPHHFMILGGGSNVLFTGNFTGLILQAAIKGMQIESETKEFCRVWVGGGVVWDEFVQWAVSHNWSGIENLSYIPGWVGASPIQNIGAYGVEVKEVIEKVEYINLQDLTIKTIGNAECRFGYRDSIFKNEWKAKALVTRVLFRLSGVFQPVTNYGNLEAEWKKFPEQSLNTLREAIIAIRKRKLPDPAVCGNAGSFFKNPVIDSQKFLQIQKNYPDVPNFPADSNQYKIPAAWLIEKCNWKGFRNGDAGVHPLQPLVLVNYGNASGKEILSLAKDIQASVLQNFGVRLECEVNIIEN